MRVEKLNDIENLLNQHPSFVNKTITDHNVVLLTGPGDNYGSLMLAVEINLKNEKTAKEETVHTVAKMSPPNEMLKEVFDIQNTFKREMEFYKTVVPTLQEFRKQNGLPPVTSFPKYYAGRYNNNHSEVVDDDAVLMLENLKNAGYENLDRMVGFDLAVAEAIVYQLAIFHATTLALKLKNPILFDETVRKYVSRFDEPMEENIVAAWANILKEDDETAHLAPKIVEIYRAPIEKDVREPFATMIHNDLWLNNIMVKVEGKSVGVKFVDFQILEYRSPVTDLLFFLFTSVQSEVLDEHYDYFVEHYHLNFTKTLTDLGCDAKQFTVDFLKNEMKIEARQAEIVHFSYMLFAIYLEKGSTVELSELKLEDFYNKVDQPLQKEKLNSLRNSTKKRFYIGKSILYQNK